MRDCLALLALLAIAAGCIGASSDAEAGPTSEPETDSARELPSYELACPPGASTDSAEPCLATLSRPAHSFDEPELAVHPEDPEVLAVGVNAHDAREAAPSTTPTPGTTVAGLQVYTSEDAGASWQQAGLPAAPDPEDRRARTSLYSDPSLAYDENGRLHATGLVSHNVHAWRAEESRWHVFHAALSPDGSWSQPVVLSEDGSNDRQWITTGPSNTLLVPWQDPFDATEVVWSTDGGQTWHGPPSGEAPARFEDCGPSSRGLTWNASVFLVCSGRDGYEATGLRVLELDREEGVLQERAHLSHLPGTWKMDAVVTPEGRFVTAAHVDHGLRLAATDRGPTGWSSPLALEEQLSVDDGLRELELFALAADPWGGVHLLVGGDEACTGPCPPQRTPPLGRPSDGSRQLAHVVVDPAKLSVVEETVLTPEGLESGLQRGTGAPRFDDFGSIAFGPDRGWIAFSHEGAIAYTLVEASR